MALTKFGFVVVGNQLDAWQVLASPSFSMIVAGVPSPEFGPQAAVRMIAEGVQLIELCGGFGPLWTARVIEATGNRVPIGSVAYGPEALTGLSALFGVGSPSPAS
jgi:hypothetical protein